MQKLSNARPANLSSPTKTNNIVSETNREISGNHGSQDATTYNGSNPNGGITPSVGSNGKGLWPEPQNVVLHGGDGKSSATNDRETDIKIQQNKEIDRPVMLDVGGTKYQVNVALSNAF